MSHLDARYPAERHQATDEDIKSDKRAFLQLLEQRVTNSAISIPTRQRGPTGIKTCPIPRTPKETSLEILSVEISQRLPDSG